MNTPNNKKTQVQPNKPTSDGLLTAVIKKCQPQDTELGLVLYQHFYVSRRCPEFFLFVCLCQVYTLKGIFLWTSISFYLSYLQTMLSDLKKRKATVGFDMLGAELFLKTSIFFLHFCGKKWCSCALKEFMQLSNHSILFLWIASSRARPVYSLK